jgi:hypothetical protein
MLLARNRVLSYGIAGLEPKSVRPKVLWMRSRLDSALQPASL